ncbi:MAG: hypothetical protein P4M11_15680 [Candidatus Pacebacteria bacterium]|nr:hypothetical protein [Candidatus Paceibacterota bacterium]
MLTKGALTTFKYYENLLRENLASYIRSNLTYTNAMFNGDSFHIPSTFGAEIETCVDMLVRSMVFPAAKATMDVMYSALNSFTSDVRYYCVLLTALCGILSAVSMAFLLWLGLNANFEVPSPHRMLV